MEKLDSMIEGYCKNCDIHYIEKIEVCWFCKKDTTLQRKVVYMKRPTVKYYKNINDLL